MCVEKQIYDRRSRPNIVKCQIATCKLLSIRQLGVLEMFLQDIALKLKIAKGRVSENKTK